MANPTFNINDLVAPVGRAPANPFRYPTQAELGNTLARQIRVAQGELDVELPENVTAGSVYKIMKPSPTPTPKPSTQTPKYAA